MGFFSWDCKKCNKSIRAPYAVDEKDAWMNEAVLLMENEFVIIGPYDGYGRIESDFGNFEIEEGDPCMYHKKCWIEAGKPDYNGPSNRARDQGFFVDD